MYQGSGVEWDNLQDGEDIFDGSHIAGPSKGRIEGSGIGGAGIGTILQVSSCLCEVHA